MLLFFWRAVVAAIISTPGRVTSTARALWSATCGNAARNAIARTDAPANRIALTVAARNAIAPAQSLVYRVTPTEAILA